MYLFIYLFYISRKFVNYSFNYFLLSLLIVFTSHSTPQTIHTTHRSPHPYHTPTHLVQKEVFFRQHRWSSACCSVVLVSCRVAVICCSVVVVSCSGPFQCCIGLLQCMGPSTEPCGTPLITGDSSDGVPSNATRCFLSERIVRIYAAKSPGTFIFCFSCQQYSVVNFIKCFSEIQIYYINIAL